ncbi:MAG: phosphoribosylamine--glycine ligase [Proteobacteria bacterium]|nr:MAG: phosphoribosylamine--glycine ligase [Pseudomonadota bacterium]
MKVLVVGSGGREHALAWKLAQGEETSEVFVAPGNPAMALEHKVTCTNISAADFVGISEFCRKNHVGFVVVGPDQALADGIVDYLEGQGLAAFGPTKAAARVEWSKAFSKEVMQAEGIPTARYEVFDALEPALSFLKSVEWGSGWVVKADGLALGKGVVVAESREEAIRTAEDFFGGSMGAAGARVVIEERLFGREVSVFSLCDGERGVLLGMACDYKRIFDGDKGPNTGGMGAFSPADWLPNGFAEEVQNRIVAPMVEAMKKRGTPFKGVLFSGLMATKDGPKVIEFNARFGDPETQVLMPLVDEDLLPWLRASRDGTLARLSAEGPKRKNLHGVHLVMAAANYPGAPRKGDAISVPEELLPQEGDSGRWAKVFFAGVARGENSFVTNGGRVLGLTTLAESREEARRKAYAISEVIRFEGMQRRGDVGV